MATEQPEQSDEKDRRLAARDKALHALTQEGDKPAYDNDEARKLTDPNDLSNYVKTHLDVSKSQVLSSELAIANDPVRWAAQEKGKKRLEEFEAQAMVVAQKKANELRKATIRYKRSQGRQIENLLSTLSSASSSDHTAEGPIAGTSRLTPTSADIAIETNPYVNEEGVLPMATVTPLQKKSLSLRFIHAVKRVAKAFTPTRRQAYVNGIETSGEQFHGRLMPREELSKGLEKNFSDPQVFADNSGLDLKPTLYFEKLNSYGYPKNGTVVINTNRVGGFDGINPDQKVTVQLPTVKNELDWLEDYKLCIGADKYAQEYVQNNTEQYKTDKRILLSGTVVRIDGKNANQVFVSIPATNAGTKPSLVALFPANVGGRKFNVGEELRDFEVQGIRLGKKMEQRLGVYDGTGKNVARR